MLENKNHKKISLSGKSLLMGTLSTAAIVLSASTANAATTNTDNVNENQTVEVTSTSANNENNNQVTEKDSVDKSTSDVAANTNTEKSNENKEVAANNTQTVATNAPVSDVKNTNTITPETTVDKVINNSTSDQKTTPNAQTTDVNQVEKKDSVDKNNTEENKETSVKPAENAAKAELKGQVKDIVEESGVDTSKLTNDQINELNKINFSKEAKSGTQLTYNDFKKIAKTLIEQDARYAVPFFNASKIKNMPAAKTLDAQSGKVEDLEIWDSWPVQDAKTGYVSNWNGYQLVIGMMGVPNVNDNHIYLLYNKYGDNDFNHWKNAGPIFGLGTPVIQQWSGSATLNKDGSIQLYYTKVDTSDNNTNHQKIASATVYLNLEKDQDKISIAHVDNDHIVFEGDGYHYQTYDQWKETNKGADNIAMRDAHVIDDEDGNRYLVFEASTGTENYQGDDQIYQWLNYGGTNKDNLGDFFQILSNSDIKDRAKWSNAAIGIIKLNNDVKNPSVAKVYSPLVSAPMVSDEIERPDVVKLGNKYYLFAATRLNRGSNDDAWMATNKAVGDNVAMIGYVSDNLTHGYVPLNESGVVLTASVPANWRTATYSYYAVPVEGRDDQLLITSYITNRGEVAGKGMHATWAPSFLLQINPDNTTTVLAKMTNQGDWIWDDSSENADMMGVLEKDAPNSAALPGEWGKPVDWDLIGGYNLKPHQPVTPIPNVPTTPEKPTTPTTPEVPTTPETPNTPENPTPEVPTNSTKRTSQTKLPKAGAKNSVTAVVLGAVSSILGAIGLTGISKRKRNN
ncbi:glycoside hydrolase family 68 protein [Lactobacillus johnsonii]|uniref:glycoside hydrolase family 68 protein n=1 Tax=Lactobacillus johnsonii TaxID=33959 RepID=UPI0028EB0E43|nr:glycoside hydrolase family 68 protein [Lactobacillus johnsonii]MDT9605405.1 glycoside hydrolase family 68 protein [Lactobacillus johnsonii]